MHNLKGLLLVENFRSESLQAHMCCRGVSRTPSILEHFVCAFFCQALGDYLFFICLCCCCSLRRSTSFQTSCVSPLPLDSSSIAPDPTATTREGPAATLLDHLRIGIQPWGACLPSLFIRLPACLSMQLCFPLPQTSMCSLSLSFPAGLPLPPVAPSPVLGKIHFRGSCFPLSP